MRLKFVRQGQTETYKWTSKIIFQLFVLRDTVGDHTYVKCSADGYGALQPEYEFTSHKSVQICTEVEH